MFTVLVPGTYLVFKNPTFFTTYNLETPFLSPYILFQVQYTKHIIHKFVTTRKSSVHKPDNINSQNQNTVIMLKTCQSNLSF